MLAVASLFLGAALTPAYAVVACGATGEVTQGTNGKFVYTVSVTWDFEGGAIPEEINLLLPTLDDCPFYDPGNPVQAYYVVPVSGVSQADAGCYDLQGLPITEIAWMGAMATVDEDCWLFGIHIEYTNSGATQDCFPLTADTGVFVFESYGEPIAPAIYYDAIVIKAGPDCVVCDYEGPLPDCNTWAPVEALRWGTIKAMYR